jgi:hypothetical protein
MRYLPTIFEALLIWTLLVMAVIALASANGRDEDE